MDFLEEIWQTIRTNTSRSILTGFGVFWGMVMLLVLVGLGGALIYGMKGAVGEMPTNSCGFFAGVTSKPYAGLQQGRAWHITTDDVAAIRKEVKEAEMVVPICSGETTDKGVRYKDISGTYNLSGTEPEYIRLFATNLAQGRFLNAIDIDQRRKVCVIGDKVREQLFVEGEEATGKLIYINSIQFRIVGVLTKSSSEISSDNDESIYIPISTCQQIYNLGDVVHQLFVTARAGIRAEVIQEKVKSLLQQRHLIAPDDERAMWIWNMQEMFDSLNMVMMGLNILLWVIGLGTLISGAVGVSNIMLITVRERTKEIGIRRALGATPWIIMRQIIAEAVLLTSLSGVAGVVTGVGILAGLSQLRTKQLGPLSLDHLQISFSMAVSAMVVIIVVGVLAGLLPATRALAIKPVEALSEE